MNDVISNVKVLNLIRDVLSYKTNFGSDGFTIGCIKMDISPDPSMVYRDDFGNEVIKDDMFIIEITKGVGFDKSNYPKNIISLLKSFANQHIWQIHIRNKRNEFYFRYDGWNNTIDTVINKRGSAFIGWDKRNCITELSCLVADSKIVEYSNIFRTILMLGATVGSDIEEMNFSSVELEVNTDH